MDYPALLHLHRGLVAISVLGFTLRWLAHVSDADWVRRRVARVLPHVVDTLLLASGVALVWRLGAWPHWLLPKLMGLLAYVALGAVAMRSPRGPRRVVAGLAALAVVAWMASVAITKQPWGALAPWIGPNPALEIPA